MCLKVVIEDQVEDTMFAQEEKHIFSMYLDSNLIPLDRSSIAVSIPLDRSSKPTTSSIEVSIPLNQSSIKIGRAHV